MAKQDFKKLLTDTYVSDRIQITEDEAIKELTDANFAVKQINREKEEDEELQSAKEIVKDMNAGYNSASKFEKAKIDFLLGKIEETRAYAELNK